MEYKDFIRRSLVLFVVSLLLISCTAFLVTHSSAETGEASPWPMFGGGINNDGKTEVAVGESSSELKWDFKTRDSIESSPALGPNGDIYVGSADGHLYSVSSEGEKEWSFNVSFLFSIEDEIEDLANNLDDENISDHLREVYKEEDYPLSEDDWVSISVVEGGEEWELKDQSNKYNHEIRKEDGKLNIFDATVRIDSSPAIDAEGNVYFGDTEGYFYSLYSNGTKRWSKDLGNPILSSPVVTEDESVHIGTLDILYSFTLNGTKKWEHVPPGYIGSTPAVDEAGRIYLSMGIPIVNWGKIEVLSPEGELIWDYKIQSENDSRIFSAPALDDEGNVYFGSHDGNLYSLDSEGNLNWNYTTEEIVFSSPAIAANGTVYVGSSDKYLYAIGENGEKRWKYETGDRVLSSPSIGSSGNIYFGSDDGRLYSLTPHGEERWNFETDGYIVSSAAIDEDGNLFFGSADHNLYSLGTDETDRLSRLYIPMIGGILIFVTVFVPVSKKYS